MVQGTTRISYGDLDRLSNTLADRLVKAGVAPGDLVGLEATQGPDTIISLLAIFRDILGQNDVTVTDSFFELGGHSLLAIKLVARIRREFGVDVPLLILFANPTCYLLSQHLGSLYAARAHTAISEEAQTPVTRRPTEAPTTEGQREIFGAILFDPDQSLAYNLPFSVTLQGPLETEAMLAALRDLLDRHDVLRARFEDSGLLMSFAPAQGSEIKWVDLTGADTAARHAQMTQLRTDAGTRRFDLERGGLFSATLVRSAEDRHEIVFSTHHIICDGWSVGVLIGDLRALYLARTDQTAPALMPVQSVSALSMAEAQWAKTGEAARDLAFWQDVFAVDVPVLDLPTDYPRPPVKTSAGAQQYLDLAPALTAQLRAMARRQGATVENVIFAAFNVFIARLSGSDDIVLGMPAAGQLAYGLERVVGHSVNFLPIRNRVDQHSSFAQVLAKIRKTQLDVLDHKKLTFGALLRQLKIGRDRSRIPLAPVAITFENVIDPAGLNYPRLTADMVWHDRPFEHFELFAYITVGAEQVSMAWSYSTDIFKAETIARYMAEFAMLLAALAAAPGRALAEIQIPAPTDRNLPNLNLAGALGQGLQVAFAREATLPQMFRDHVRRHPDAVALIEGGQTVRYGDLGRRVDAIAQRLQAHGVALGDTVGIALERSANMVASMLATMQLGAAYVPLDPSNPPERLAYIAKDAGLACSVSDVATAQRLGFAGAVTLDDLDAAEIAQAPPAPQVGIDPLSTAYIAYTSGSTGKPKGVMGTHRATVNRFSWMWRVFPFADDEVMCQKTAISFVDSVWEIFGPLLAGVPQVIIPTATLLEPKVFLATLAQQRVTRLLVVPSLLKALLGAGVDLRKALPSLRMIFCSGEVLPAALARQVLAAAPDVQLINLYGSSEVAADVTWEVVRSVDNDTVSIGRPIDNACVYVLDEASRPVSLGETGELYVGGEGLAAGYLNRLDLTAARFMPDPFMALPGARMFATGDLVFQLADGRLMFKGRADDQVKIRGARVELGEVELALTGLPDVAEAAVVAAPYDGDTTLYAYILAKGGTAPEPRLLRSLLARQLPSYMVPTHFVVLDAMPLNPNGKIDRAALKALGLAQAASRVDDTQMDASAADMLNIWGRLIGIDKIRLDDDFFVIGGHSLMAVKLFAQIRQAFGVELPISALLEYPTPRRLLQRVRTEREAPAALATSVFAGAPENTPWDTTAVIHPGPGNGAKALFIAGGVGGNVNNLFELGQFIGQHRPLIGLQTRGILGHRMHDSIEATAADHIVNMRIRQPKGPYLLAGYSGGVFSAFEMARQLREAGETVAFLGLLDMTAPNFESSLAYPRIDRIRYQARMLRQHGLRPLWTNIIRRLGNDINPADVGKLGAWLWPEKFKYGKIMHHWRMLSGIYLPKPYDGDAWLYLTNSDTDGFTVEQMRKADPLFGWPGLVKGRLKVHPLHADHLGMVSGERGRILAQTMEGDIKLALQGE